MAGRGEAYERLLDGPGEDDAAPIPTVPPSPSRTFVPLARGQQAVKTSAGAGEAGTYNLTASAGAPPAQQGAPTVQAAAATEAAELAQLENTPDAVAEFEEASNLITIWMGMAIGTLILSFMEFKLGTLAAIVGIMGSVGHVFTCCRRPVAVAEAIKTTHVLALAAALLSAIATITTAVLCFSMSRHCEELEDYVGEERERQCDSLVELLFFYILWFALYAGLSFWIARIASRLRRLLNPVTNGVVSVGV